MKRSANDAFGTSEAAAAAAPAGPTVFQPDATAMLDPKEYFKQWQQHNAHQPTSAPPPPFWQPQAAAAPAPAGAQVVFRSDEHPNLKLVQEASAVRCAAVVKERGKNFTTAVALEALCTMATKSSMKLREELARQPDVRKLCQRVSELIRTPPAGLGIETLARAAWSLTRFPKDVRGDTNVVLGATVRTLASLPATAWDADSAAKVLWSLAKADVITQHKQLVSQVVAELVRDLGRRVAELSHERLVDLLWSVARARRHVHKGDHLTVHTEPNDEHFFAYAAKRVAAEIDDIDVKLLADLCHTHAEIGIRNEALFKAICPRIVAKQKDIREDMMARVIKAYTRFMIPLTDEKQGFRTMAVVQKGDFIRPSEKPRKQGKRVYDHPTALYPNTQVHSRG